MQFDKILVAKKSHDQIVVITPNEAYPGRTDMKNVDMVNASTFCVMLFEELKRLSEEVETLNNRIHTLETGEDY